MDEVRLDGAEFEQLLDDLESLLQEERAALGTRNLAALEACSSQKENLFFRLSTYAARFEASQSEPRHTFWQQRLQQIHDMNLVNGTVIARSQQSTREMIALLTGHVPNGLYGASGQPTTDQKGGLDLGQA